MIWTIASRATANPEPRLFFNPYPMKQEPYIGKTMAVIGDKMFVYRRGGVVIIGPGYRRWIPNSWYSKEDITAL